MTEEEIYSYSCEDELAPLRSEGTEEKSIIKELIKQLSPSQELYSLSMPAFVMRPVSLLEKLSTYAIPNSLIEDINVCEKPELRMLKVVLWVLSNWRSVPSNTLQGSKPYNPILGEVFECSWEHDSDKSVTKYISEQVSHKPPVSAFYSYNGKRQMAYYGFVEPKLGFHWNSVHSEFCGQFKLDFFKLNEKYTLKLPHVYCTGIFMGERNIEIWDQLSISCAATGLEATVDFKGNALTGKVFKFKKVFYTLEGAPEKIVKVKDIEEKKDWLAYEASKIKREPIKVEKIEKQKDNESRKVWHHCTASIRKGEFSEATKQKNIVEDVQRKLASERKEKGIEWTPVLFQFQQNQWEVKKAFHKRVPSIDMLREDYSLSSKEVNNLKDFFVKTTNKESVQEETPLSEEEFNKVKEEVLRLLEERDKIEAEEMKLGRSRSDSVDLNENMKKLNRMGSLLGSNFKNSSFVNKN